MKQKRFLFFVVIFLLLLSACIKIQPQSAAPSQSPPPAYSSAYDAQRSQVKTSPITPEDKICYIDQSAGRGVSWEPQPIKCTSAQDCINYMKSHPETYDPKDMKEFEEAGFLYRIIKCE